MTETENVEAYPDLEAADVQEALRYASAAREGRVVVSADTDFGTLLAVRKSGQL